MSAGQKIIDGLKEAIAGDLPRVTIDGQTWMRADAIHADQQLLMKLNNRMRKLLLEAREHVPPELLEKIEATVR